MTVKVTQMAYNKADAKRIANSLRRGNIIAGYAGREITAYVPHTMTPEQLSDRITALVNGQ